MNSWIYKYYIEPIVMDSGYNPVNTITWAVLLCLSILLLVRLLRRMAIEVNDGLVVATLPYILAGSTLRVIEDAEILAPPAKYLLITPLIYILVAMVAMTSLVLSWRAYRSLKPYAAAGVIWTGANLALLLGGGVARPWILGVVALLGTGLTASIYFALTRFGQSFLQSRFNQMILYSHMLDASSTYIGVDWLGYREKHVVPNLMIDAAGTALVMFPLKLAVILPILAIIDGSMREEGTAKSLTKLVLITLGLAPAVRNTLRMALGI